MNFALAAVKRLAIVRYDSTAMSMLRSFKFELPPAAIGRHISWVAAERPLAETMGTVAKDAVGVETIVVELSQERQFVELGGRLLSLVADSVSIEVAATVALGIITQSAES